MPPDLYSRLLGCLHHCLATGQHYNENTAFPAESLAVDHAATIPADRQKAGSRL
jgi:hypothetical protein